MSISPHAGHLCLFLNAHMPYTAPTSKNDIYLQKWLCSALFNSYIPIIEMFERLDEEDIPFRINVAISPTLLELLQSPEVADLCDKYLKQRLEHCHSEVREQSQHAQKLHIAQHNLAHWQHIDDIYRKRYSNRIVKTLNRLVKNGHLELLVSSATSAYLPLLEPNELLARGQIYVGKQSFDNCFEIPAQGFWSLNGGYTSSLEDQIIEAGLGYTIVRSLSVLGATPRPQMATYRPIRTPSGLTVFPTDIESTLDIFQERTGFINSPEYLSSLEDNEEENNSYINGIHSLNFSSHYYNSTQSHDKESQLYDIDKALKLAKVQAKKFIENRRRQATWIATRSGQSAVITISIKAEIFGNTWYEGIHWLEEVLRLSANDPDIVCSHFGQLYRDPGLQICSPNSGSSHRGSFNANWLNESNAWIYKHLFLAGRRMIKMAKLGHQNDAQKLRLINQAVRELLLAQCSDWSTLISLGLEVRWARKIIRRHLVTFHKLFDDMREGKIDEEALQKLENRCRIFPNIDYRACYLRDEKKGSKPSNDISINSSSGLSLKKDEIISGIVQIQTVTRELATMCQQALLNGGDISIDISLKACESVAIVESLVKNANDPMVMQRYLTTTTTLENIIKVISASQSSQELSDLHKEAIEAVDAWAKAVENLLRSIINQAN